MAARRASAIGVLSAIFYSWIAPLAFAGAGSNLPVCCRRAGAHRCEMTAPSAPGSGPAARTGRCAEFPTVKALPGAPTVTAPAKIRDAQMVPDHPSALELRADPSEGGSCFIAHPKRGPPDETVLA